MPVVLELIVLMVVAYASGFGIGWMIWGSSANGPIAEDGDDDDEGKDGDLP